MDEPRESVVQPVDRVGKGEGSAPQIRNTRAHCVVDTFNGGGFSELVRSGVGAAFEAATMLKRLVIKECGIGIVAIGEDQIALPGRWHLLPELARTLSIARPQMEGQDLQG